jgi:hypothetical protein
MTTTINNDVQGRLHLNPQQRAQRFTRLRC